MIRLRSIVNALLIYLRSHRVYASLTDLAAILEVVCRVLLIAQFLFACKRTSNAAGWTRFSINRERSWGSVTNKTVSRLATCPFAATSGETIPWFVLYSRVYRANFPSLSVYEPCRPSFTTSANRSQLSLTMRTEGSVLAFLFRPWRGLAYATSNEEPSRSFDSHAPAKPTIAI